MLLIRLIYHFLIEGKDFFLLINFAALFFWVTFFSIL